MAWVDSRASILIPGLLKMRLDGALKRLRKTAELCKMEPWWRGDSGPTYAEWIQRMLDMMEGRRRRKKRWRERKREEALNARFIPTEPAAE